MLPFGKVKLISITASLALVLLGLIYSYPNILNIVKDKCTLVHPEEVIAFSNDYWQVAKAKNKDTNYLFRAYYDDRLGISQGKYFIRVIGVNKRQNKMDNILGELWCKLLYSNDSVPKIVKVSPILMWPNNFGLGGGTRMLPYLYSCDLSEIKRETIMSTIPFSVSLVKNPCSAATNKLKITKPKMNVSKPKRGIVVCVKGLDFPHAEVSYRLIEWIELLKLLGVNKIHFYLYSVLPDTIAVLEYYKRQGILDITPISLPGNLPNDPLKRHLYLRKYITQKRQLEIIHYNDCLYRYMHTHQFIVPLDIDEIIIPKVKKTWEEMLDAINASSVSQEPKSEISSFNVKQNGCYFHGVARTYISEIPEYMHMLQHIYKLNPQVKNSELSSSGTKGFMNTDLVKIVLNHMPGACIERSCTIFNIPVETSQLQHYKHYHRHCGLKRGTTSWECKELSCLKYMQDETIWKYKNQLIRKVKAAVLDLQLMYQEVDMMKENNTQTEMNTNINA